ncbi:type IV secretory system conjugative DNA transfer family protein [Streptomyces sp. NPDC051018]|uniref:type IV secretory system conjugative DNA transfer family protein n=1 Tax=Streptomyces sp. NPDC051018 TaxID=3365639 RepID=UPI00379FFF9B
MGEQHQQRTGGGGVPDGLLLGLLGFFLSALLLVWTATGLAGLLAKGSWPTGVTFKNTPQAVRSLVGSPQDLPAAWPATPPVELSGYGLFWGIAISELMVLIVLTIFILGTLARWKAVRAARRDRMRVHGKDPAGPRTARTPQNQPYEHEHPAHHHTAPRPDAQDLTAPPSTPSDPPPAPGSPQHPAPPAPAVPATPNASAPHAFAEQGPWPPRTEGTSPPVAGGRSAGQGSPAPSTPLPSPRVPRVLFGDPATRRPTTVQAVRDAEGAALVVTSDPTVWAETKDARAKLGPVLVYDPGHLCDTPARLHWSPTAGCSDATTAAARATSLLAPVRPRSALDAAMADTADTLLRCWLHAAAVDGRPFKQVHRWALGAGAQEAVRILRTHPKATAGFAGLLESALTAHPERREIAQQLVARALSSLSSIHIREACTPNRTDSLTLESFLNEGGTLYLVGEPIEDPKAHPGAMPLLTALASDVVEHGRRVATGSSDGRLDPPMTLILDDVAAVAPFPLLPDLLTTGQEAGLPTLVLLRSAEQARARWPQSDLPV